MFNDIKQLFNDIYLYPVKRPTGIIDYLQDDNIFMYYLIMTKLLQYDWITWEPQTIWETCFKLYKLNFTDYQKNAINAIRVLHYDDYYSDWIAFEKISLGLNKTIPEFDIVQDISPSQICWSIYISKIMRGDLEFSNEVKKYIACRFLEKDNLLAPPPADLSQSEINILSSDQNELRNKVINRNLELPDEPDLENPEDLQIMKYNAIVLILKENEIDTYSKLSKFRSYIS